MKTLCRIVHLPWTRKALLLEAAGWLGLAWLLVRGLPFRFWSRWLGTQVPGEVDFTGVGSDDRVWEVTRSVMVINERLGSRFSCLMMAMAVQWMLSRRRIASSLVLGTLSERDTQQRLAFKAHAWVRAGAGVVLGDHDDHYLPIASFVRHHPALEREPR